MHVGGVAEFDRRWPPRIAEALARRPKALRSSSTFRRCPCGRCSSSSATCQPTPSSSTARCSATPAAARTCRATWSAPLAAASSAPLYGAYDTFSGLGIVAGSISDSEEEGRAAGRLALRVLAGEDPSTIPVERGSLPRPWADWEQIERFRLDPDLTAASDDPGQPPGVGVGDTPRVDHRWRRLSSWSRAPCVRCAPHPEPPTPSSAERSATQRSLELAHASRLAMAGELTASITHEINQPLGAILNNADAAEMMLDQDPTRVLRGSRDPGRHTKRRPSRECGDPAAP